LLYDEKVSGRPAGVGIAPDNLAKIFDAFQQLGSIHSGGLGLGLFIVRCAADALGHRLEV
jgi:signal transduction histidine kinase